MIIITEVESLSVEPIVVEPPILEVNYVDLEYVDLEPLRMDFFERVKVLKGLDLHPPNPFKQLCQKGALEYTNFQRPLF